LQNGFDYMLSLRARDQDRGSHDEVHAPEFLMSDDVLRRHATGAFGQCSIVTSLLVGAEFAFGMREKVSAITVEREHEEQFGVQPWRWNLICG
jgi:hypothetical protein